MKERFMESALELLIKIFAMQIIGSCQQCNTNSKLNKLIELQENRK